jgi:hypothetical protein
MLFQLLAALVYQCHVGAVGKIVYNGNVEFNGKHHILEMLSEVIPNELCLDYLDFENQTLTLLNTQLSFQKGNKVLLVLTASGDLPKYAHLPGISDDVDSSCIGWEDDDSDLEHVRCFFPSRRLFVYSHAFFLTVSGDSYRSLSIRC